ncbi:DUF3955 domain-containing protein [Vulcanococcus sp.]|uniref:DUF3955 domain-containing protein n=1 Tax=Vulcanococcus sp. TaxID=2856995 RepID=UPI003F695667
MKPLPTLAALCSVGCVSCAVAYQAIGVQIDSDGTLREPFALIPIGYLMGSAAIVTGAPALFTAGSSKRGLADYQQRSLVAPLFSLPRCPSFLWFRDQEVHQ